MNLREEMTLLGIFDEREPTPDKVMQAFRKLSLKHHPDKGGDAATFRCLVEARYEVLTYWDSAMELHRQHWAAKTEKLVVGHKTPYDIAASIALKGGLF